jgi:glyoxylate utilization-related uncharacterized protein
VLRFLDTGQAFNADDGQKHQLLYLMAGTATINLEGKDHAVTKGMGIYLGPGEKATISATESGLKLFHLTVPQIPK